MRLFHWLFDLLKDPGPFIQWAGYPGLAAIVFLETGAMVFFLPGDSLLVVAGLFASRGDMSIFALNGLLIPLAIAGPVSSYWIGARLGRELFTRPRSRFFRPEHLVTAQAFYEKHGAKAVVIARFMPIVRTFVPVVAGIGRMNYARYTLYNVVGGAAWVLSMTLVGYFLGAQFPALGKHIEKVIIVVVFLSLLPGILGYLRERRGGRAAA